MTKPPRLKRRFQFHLSTAIVMMFVAGGLIWANTIERRGWVGYFQSGCRANDRTRREISENRAHELMENDQASHHFWADRVSAFRGYGWPFYTVEWQVRLVPKDLPEDLVPTQLTEKIWHEDKIILNCYVALILLVSVYFLCEWLIRRRSARKEA